MTRDAFKQGPVYQRRRELKMVQSLYGNHVTDTTAELEKLMAPGERMIISMPPACCSKYNERKGAKTESDKLASSVLGRLFSKKNALIEEAGEGASDGPDCTKARCRQNFEKFSERLMLDLASFSTYLSERAAALRSKRAAQILSDRLFRQSRAHEQLSAKPILPGSRQIGQGFSVPRGVTVGSYFGVNTFNIERSRITSELTGRYSVPAALDVIPMHQYDEPRVQVYTDMPHYMRRQAEEHRLLEARSMLAHSPGTLHMQVSLFDVCLLVRGFCFTL
jgi:hypothetical protein